MSNDEEIDRLISAYLDGTLSGDDRNAFERAVRECPGTLKRTADAVRFETQIADAVRPDHLELIQERRIIIDRTSGNPVLMESTHRVARSGMFTEHPLQTARRKSPWWLVIPIVLAILTVCGVWVVMKKERAKTETAPLVAWTALPLKNPGFEFPDLGSAPAKSNTLDHWQDKFTTPNATLQVFPVGSAHGGKQVAALAPGGHVKQLLFDSKGEAVLFEPDSRIRVTGWVKPNENFSGRADIIHTALHFVDDQNRQYVVAYQIASLDGSGWRRFTVELIVPVQETFEPSFNFSTGEVTAVRGRQVLLSITNISAQLPKKTSFMLDDMVVEILPAGDSSVPR